MTKIWYDAVSSNTGDLAIGVSLKKIFKNVEESQPTTGDMAIIGGGLLLRNYSDPFFDKFRVKGHHILNCMGLYGSPNDLHYLDEYKYISVRSSGDKTKLSYLKREVKVVPCTTMLLNDEYNFTVKENAIGIHLLHNFLKTKDEQKFCDWANQITKKGFNLYFILITSDPREYPNLQKLSNKINNSIVVNLTPLETFSFIGKMKFMISCSLHGGIFAYVHNVPFILFDKTLHNGDDKMKWFMLDRNIQNDLFYNLDDAISKFNCSRDYTSLIAKDKKVLGEHLYNIKCLI